MGVEKLIIFLLEPYPFFIMKRRPIQGYLSKAVSCPSESPWSSPMVLIKKKNEALRFCSGYRGLFNVTKKDVTQYRSLRFLRWVVKNSIFLRLIFRLPSSGYGRITKWKNSFSNTTWAIWTPCGLTNAGSTFPELIERVMERLLSKFVFVCTSES